LPDLVKDLNQVNDPRHISYINYDIGEILYTAILKNVCTISSMQDMTDKFNTQECVHNLCLILGKEKKDEHCFMNGIILRSGNGCPLRKGDDAYAVCYI
jgi:hypothetical protein